jgi:PleD family two-component response regulator
VAITGGAPLQVSVSGGLRMISPDEKTLPLAEAMAEADTALYAAKAGGRNRIVLADGSPMPQPGG